jgi:hypothetical protein
MSVNGRKKAKRLGMFSHRDYPAAATEVCCLFAGAGVESCTPSVMQSE